MEARPPLVREVVPRLPLVNAADPKLPPVIEVEVTPPAPMSRIAEENAEEDPWSTPFKKLPLKER